MLQLHVLESTNYVSYQVNSILFPVIWIGYEAAMVFLTSWSRYQSTPGR